MLRIGVVGLGRIGSDHIERIRAHIAGAVVSGVVDADRERAASYEAKYGYRAFDDHLSLVRDPSVDAVVIASPGPLHAEQIMACIEAGKPVFCEKPLASTYSDGLRVIREEISRGRRFVQLGFMRRFDDAFMKLKETVGTGEIGTPLVMHCIHRNPSVRPGYNSLNALDDSLTHEIDVARWLLDEEIVAARVLLGKPSPLSPGLQDPKIVLLESQSGAVVDVEIFVTCQYGYDVRCEIVGSQGVASTTSKVSPVQIVSAGAARTTIASNWSERFGESYARELTSWVDSVRGGTVTGPSAWDGYAATFVAEHCVKSLTTGERVTMDVATVPEIYRTVPQRM